VCTQNGVVCAQSQWPAPESCNGLDDDCDGAVDNGNPGGGVACGTGQPGVCAAGHTVCSAGAVSCQPITPASPEVCGDGLDNNCNGLVDETGGMVYRDVDGDGHGNPATGIQSCSPPAGYVTAGDDCDDNDNRVFPGQTAFFGTARPNLTYDYNCDGSDEKKFPQRLTCTNGPGGCQANGTWFSATIPNCGKAGFAATCSASCTSSITTSQQQLCR
jgi:hypothetical protein